jgi:peptidoglycan/xylan/chitin deacetylase (PgdA/CDA1 family)
VPPQATTGSDSTQQRQHITEPSIRRARTDEVRTVAMNFLAAASDLRSRTGRLLRTAVRISKTRYPGFILGLPLEAGEIPVFTYHDVEADAFARDLDYLNSNGYRTLGLEEYLGARAGKYRPGRSVLLTFDDARKSFAQVALPALRSCGARAVLFAPTYWMAPPAAHRSPDQDLFMSWEQLRECVASGLVDVQSHAHRHTLVATCAQVVDFASPQALARFDIYDWPMRYANGADELGHPAPGTPVYRAAPLLSAARRYLENSELAHACREHVASCGGSELFQQRGWLRYLHALHRKLAAHMPGHFMALGEFYKLMASEFEHSRADFERELGYAPICIAYPWMLGSELSLQLARRHGLRAAFGVALDYGAERRRARLPMAVYGRLKCDWLRFLPGAQRRSVLAAVREKLSGFSRTQHLAH